jgi:hypothetical protein
MKTYHTHLNKPAALLALGAVFSAATASAQIVTYVEDFEDTRSGGTLNDGQVIYSTFSDWGATGVVPGNQTITVDKSAPSNAFTPTSGSALFYDDNDSTTGGNLRFKMEQNENSAGDLADAVTTFSFDYYNVDNQQSMRVLVGDSGGLNKLSLEIFRPAGTVGQIFNGNQFVAATDGGDNWLKKNRWYRYALTIDSAADTYDLSILEAGNTTARYDVTGLPIRNANGTAADLGTITQIEFTPFDGSGIGHEAYLDNFAITQVPEPSAATLLLGLAVLGLAIRRR